MNDITDFTAILNPQAVNKIGNYTAHLCAKHKELFKEEPKYAEAALHVLAEMAHGGETVGRAVNYLLNVAEQFLYQNTPNASYGSDTPWTHRGMAIDASNSECRIISEIIKWFRICCTS